MASAVPPKGTIIFSTVGRTEYGFDVFSARLNLDGPPTENRLTDGVSVNFNAQFVDGDEHDSVVFISERTGSPRIYLTRPNRVLAYTATSASLFLDRPVIKNNTLYFISAHEQPDRLLNCWSALYCTTVCTENSQEHLDSPSVTRLTPYGTVDYSPAISKSGKYVAVASYGSRPWGGEFYVLNTDIVVFRSSEPEKRFVLCEHGGWPTWSGDSTIFFHRQADEDKWWSIYRADITESTNQFSDLLNATVTRITPPGVHCFTPAAFDDGKRIAVTTRRPGNKYRHIEIFDVESKSFSEVTQLLNPSFHHYNPFVSPDSKFVGYHRFRGDSMPPGNMVIPHLEPVGSPESGIGMLRINGNFPAVSPCGGFIASNYTLDRSQNPGVNIIKSDGSKSWMLLKDHVAFYNAWSPTERHVIYTSLGPIFEAAKTTVQIARIEFDPSYLNGPNYKDIPCNVKILTRENVGNNAFPSCSPDGKHIVFRSGRSGYKNLYIIDAVNGELEGGSIHRLTEGEWIDTMPSWSPKGDLIAFSSNMHNPSNTEAFGIYVIKPDGSGLRRVQVAGSDNAKRERLNHVCFSKDGEWILFTSNLGGVTAEPVSLPNQFQPYGDLYLMKLDGTGLRRLTWNGYENGTPSWYNHDDEENNFSDLMNKLCLGNGVGEKLSGNFDEPIWIK